MSEKKRELIIRVAQSLFARFGFKKTTMNEIAKNARMGKSSIYHYFKTKEDVFKAVIEKEIAHLREEFTKAVEKASGFREKLRAYITTRFHHLRTLTSYWSPMDEYFEQYSFIKKARRKILEEEINTVKRILKEEVKKGVLACKNLTFASLVFVTALKGLESSYIEKKEIEKGIDSLLEILLNGIRRR
jgi:AcrR family transcriptional regulator